ncbi:MinD/ParA family protein [Bacillus sp. REN10]|uniref:MinD/ParA family protein n=1 Tax=Bacillus sp. REN10 TaxID=2782541 RepID=UPI00193B4C98|nr:MinD/ParA family protein [Bacillus sp. REN10]
MTYDQASGLRQKINRLTGKLAKTVAVVSGKGGVGKSNISMNFGLNLTRSGQKVLIFDMDIGMGNIHVLSGITGERSIVEFFEKGCSLEELIMNGTEGVSYILGGSGLSQLVEWNDYHLERWLSAVEELQYQYDYLIFDMGAGVTKESLDILMSVDDIFVVTTPEPTSITDAYSMIKFIHLRGGANTFYLVCNRAESLVEGKEVIKRLQNVVDRFLQRELIELGILPEDQHVKQAVIKQMPFSLAFPYAPISTACKTMTNNYLTGSKELSFNAGASSFVQKLRHFFMKGRSEHEK